MSDVEADLVIGLRKLAGVEGVPSNFEIDGVTVDYVGGSSSRLTLSARYDSVAHAHVAPGGREAGYRTSAKGGRVSAVRPMSITLRTEDGADRTAKAEAISREHQTGDEAFDREVYIDSPTIDAVALDAVLSEQVRAATLELLSLGFASIVIDDEGGNVTALISGFMQLRDVKDAPSRVATAFASLLSGLPPVARAPGAHPDKSPLPTFLAVVGGIALLVGTPMGCFEIAGAYGCTESSADGEGVSLKSGCHGPAALALFVAAFVALIASAVARAIAKPHVSGHSDSHKRLLMITLAAYAWVALAAFLLTAYFGYSMLKV